jgi:RecB family exonuclease
VSAGVEIQGGNGHPAVPVTLPGPPESQASAAEVAEVLSPSQATKYLGCPASWYFRYVRQLSDPQTAALALGKALHSGVGFWMMAKRDGTDLEPAAAGEAYSDAWDEEIAQTELRDDEDPGELHDQGRELTELYIRDYGPGINPAEVELPVCGKIAGVTVQGFVDLVEVDGRVIDFKTRSKSPAGIPADHRLQLTTYDLLCPQSRGQARIEYLIKTKKPKIVTHSTEIGADDVAYAEVIYPMVQDSIRDGVYYPRRSDRFPCTRRYCSFWRACEQEFSGRVAP